MIFIVLIRVLAYNYVYGLQNRAQIYAFFLINKETASFYRLFV